MRFLPLSVLLTTALLVPPRSAGAQAEAPISLRASPAQFAATSALLPQANSASEQPAMLGNVVAREHGTRHEGMVLMIVGLAGIVTGLVVDEPVVTVLGAVAGGVGLYFYLR